MSKRSFIAKLAASVDAGSNPGGFTKCDSGSATPQNTNPIPIPAPNNIPNHEDVLYSGFESSEPNFILPYLLKAKN